jgi:CRISPR/Cas system-associated protein Cas7 (RAMP superfamily)
MWWTVLKDFMTRANVYPVVTFVGLLALSHYSTNLIIKCIPVKSDTKLEELRSKVENIKEVLDNIESSLEDTKRMIANTPDTQNTQDTQD